MFIVQPLSWWPKIPLYSINLESMSLCMYTTEIWQIYGDEQLDVLIITGTITHTHGRLSDLHTQKILTCTISNRNKGSLSQTIFMTTKQISTSVKQVCCNHYQTIIYIDYKIQTLCLMTSTKQILIHNSYMYNQYKLCNFHSILVRFRFIFDKRTSFMCGECLNP